MQDDTATVELREREMRQLEVSLLSSVVCIICW